MKKLLIFSILVLFSTKLLAQRQQMRVMEHYSFGYAMGKKISTPSFMYSQMLNMGEKHKFAVGTGLRITVFSGKEKKYTGISDKLSSVSITPVPKASMTVLNIPLIAEYSSKKFIAGFNIDLIGLSFGKKRDSLIVKNYSEQRLDSLSVKPTNFNFLLGTKGNTNNEIYIGFKPQDEITIRAGVSFLFTKYTANYRKNGKDVELGKFRYDVPVMPFISIVFNFEK